MRYDPPPCPVCHDTATRATTPLAPDTDAYTCERCGHTWSD